MKRILCFEIPTPGALLPKMATALTKTPAGPGSSKRRCRSIRSSRKAQRPYRPMG